MAGGGAERVMSYLLPYLIKKGHSVILVLMNETLDYSIPKEVPIHYIEKSQGNEPGIYKFFKLPWLALKYARLLKKEKVTHSFSLLTRPCYINIMARWFTNHPYKLMISERNYPSLQYGGSHIQARINSFMVKRLYPKADSVLSNAQASAKDLVMNFNIDQERIRTINNPIDIDKINAIQKKEGLFDKNYINAVSIGRLVKEKNHNLLLEAMVPFKNLRLYIFGEGALRQELEEKIEKLDLQEQAFLMGFESNPYQYLKAADFFLFGSINEGFPNVLLEAMACSLPILTTNCKSGPDEIMELKEYKNDDIMFTDYGILTPVNNASLMRKALDYVIINPEYLTSCRPNLLERVKAYERGPILESYRQHILS